ncbi:MAG: flavin reductase family protein, partial [Candidatus Omnitrophica bacterium]|nr:flavin reductase family protein [Candidatus Omnitrophota bacterium]
MAKKVLQPDTALYPCPVVLVSVTDSKGRANCMTASWCGIVCSNPPLISVSIRPKRLTGEMIKEVREFVINIPRTSLVKEVDLAGILSGRS